jgi:hypothetical protein
MTFQVGDLVQVTEKHHSIGVDLTIRPGFHDIKFNGTFRGRSIGLVIAMTENEEHDTEFLVVTDGIVGWQLARAFAPTC